MDGQLYEAINHEKFAKELLDNSFYALSSLYKKDSLLNAKPVGGFIRDVNNNDNKFYTTATFAGILSLAVNGKDFDKDNILGKIDIETIFGDLRDVIENSSHAKEKTKDGKHSLRISLLIVQICRIMLSLKLEKDLYPKCIGVIDEYIDAFLSQKNILDRAPGTSTFSLVNVTLCMFYRKIITEKHNNTVDPIDKNKYDANLKHYNDLIFNHINFHMARANELIDISFDSNSLTTALYGYCIINPDFKKGAFYKSCIKVVIRNQNPDGCWPAGVSISFSDNQDVNPLPSVEIATFLIESFSDKNLLVDHNETNIEILEILLPCLRKFAKYLDLTYQNTGVIKGWYSDRIGIKENIETWITAFACQFIQNYWITEKAMLRSLSLKALGVGKYCRRNNDLSKDLPEKWDKVIEPNQTVQTVDYIYKEYLKPILNQEKSNKILCQPEKNKVSFMLFGPPGSGKTFLIKKISELLDWPVIELSPGHFIKNGLELIESTAKEIFDLLANINHAIVLFDECDELFRKRPKHNDSIENTRTILSFATASMLPKLQKLHDERNLLFILATNFLQNIDTAIRRPGRFDDIFLYDRPDFTARLNLIEAEIERKKEDKVQKGEVFDDSVIDRNRLVNDSANCTISEILYACNTTHFKMQGNTSAQDYIEWKAEEGILELDNSRYAESERKSICLAWNVEYKNNKSKENE